MNRFRRRLTTASLLAPLAAGSSAARAAIEGDIRVAQVGPFTVLAAPDATQLGEGMQALFADVNARGGINGRSIGFQQWDDAYNAERFIGQVNEALRHKPLALLSPVGSTAVKRLLDDKLLDAADVIVLNAVPGAEVLRNPGHPKLFHIRAGDRQQIEKIVRHAQTLGIARMAVAYQELPMGTSGFAAARDAAQRLGGITISGFNAKPEPASLVAAAQQVSHADVQAVLVVGAPNFMAQAIAELRKAGVSQSLFALSYLPPQALVKAAGDGARGVGIAQAFPNPMGIALPLQREFHAAMKRSHAQLEAYSVFHLEGYVTAKTLVEALRRAREATPAAVARALHAAGDIDLGGFHVDFSKGNHGSAFVDIGVVNAQGRLVY